MLPHERRHIALAIAVLAANSGKVVAVNHAAISSLTIGGVALRCAATVAMVGLCLFGSVALTGRKSILLFLYLVQSAWLFTFASYHDYFGSYINVRQALTLIGEAGWLISNLAIPKTISGFIALIDLPLFILFLLRLEKVKVVLQPVTAPAMLLLSAAFAGFLSLKIAMIGSPFALAADRFQGEEAVIHHFGLTFFTVFSAFDNCDLAKKINLPATVVADGRGNKPHPNIILIQIESLDAQMVGQMYEGEPVMPYLNGLSHNSVYFPAMLAFHSAGGTSDAEIAVINSFEPLSFFPSIKITNYNYDNSFVRDLVSGGYTAFAFHGNDGAFFNRNIAYRRMGFNDFVDIKKMGLKESSFGASDGDLFNYVADRSRTSKTPFFFHVITISSHEPYHFVKHHEPRFDRIKTDIIRDYYNSMAYVDTELEKFMRRLADLPNTYVFIYGDHAPYDINLHKDGLVSSDFSASVITKPTKMEFVPLLVMTPGRKRYTERKHAVSMVDMAPTILGISGVPYSILSDGRNLLGGEITDDALPVKSFYFNRSDLYKIASSVGR